jgi:hypothetical protein
MSGAKKALADAILNKEVEPDYSSKISLEPIDIIQALNYYYRTKTPEDARKWLCEWCVKHNHPCLSTVSTCAAHEFGNAGFLARMLLKGAPDDGTIHARIDKKIRGIEAPRSKKAVETQKVRKKIEEPNTMLEEFDYCIDGILVGEKNSPEMNLSTNKRHLSECREKAMSLLDEINECPDQYRQHKKMVTFIKSLIQRIDDLTDAVKKQRTKAKPVAKKKPAANIVEKLSLGSLDESTGFTSLHAVTIVGASRLILWNPVTRVLSSYITSSDTGLTVSGKSLRGFDEEKSISKKIRKPQEMAEAIKGMTATKVHIWLRDVCKTTATEPKALIADGSIIITKSN